MNPVPSKRTVRIVNIKSPFLGWIGFFDWMENRCSDPLLVYFPLRQGKVGGPWRPRLAVICHRDDYEFLR